MTALTNSAFQSRGSELFPEGAVLFEVPRTLQFEPQFQKFSQWLRDQAGYAIKNEDLFRAAITHSSVERVVGYNYERLEFLGDGVLNLWITDMEVRAGFGCQGRRLGNRGEAATYVSNQFLSNAAVRSGLTSLAISNSEQTFAEGRKAAGDLVESVTAAIYLDSGSLEQAGAFINSMLSNVRTFRKFLTQFQEVGVPADDMLFLPAGVRDFVGRFGFNGRGDRLFSTAILSDLSGERYGSAFADLYGLGNRAHQLLCRTQVYSVFPSATEADLSRKAVDFGKEILKKVSQHPLWVDCEAELPGSSKIDPSLNRQRYHALIGAVYRLGGLSAVVDCFGSLYQGQDIQGPPPGAPSGMLPIHQKGFSRLVA